MLPFPEQCDHFTAQAQTVRATIWPADHAGRNAGPGAIEAEHCACCLRPSHRQPSVGSVMNGAALALERRDGRTRGSFIARPGFAQKAWSFSGNWQGAEGNLGRFRNRVRQSAAGNWDWKSGQTQPVSGASRSGCRALNRSGWAGSWSRIISSTSCRLGTRSFSSILGSGIALERRPWS